MVEAMRAMGSREGLFAAPEGAATWAATRALVRRGFVGRDDTIVLFNAGTGLKYADLIEAHFPTIDPARTSAP